jgi:hypothetical protein
MIDYIVYFIASNYKKNCLLQLLLELLSRKVIGLRHDFRLKVVLKNRL